MPFISKEEWYEIVTQLYDMSFHKENLINVSKVIKQINFKIKYNIQLITSTALMLYGKYYLQQMNTISRLFNSEQIIYDACACFLIATKITNYLCSVDMILRAVNINERNNHSVKKEVLRREMDILIANNFDLNFEMAYNYIKVIKDKIEDFQIEREFIKMWVYYINDSFLIPLYVKYDAIVIALACLQMVICKWEVDMNVKDLILKGEWEVDMEEVEECVILMKELIYNEVVPIGRNWNNWESNMDGK